MDITLEYLKKEDLKQYKNLLDEIFDKTAPIEFYQENYSETHPFIKVVVAKTGEKIIGTITFALIDSFTNPQDARIEFFNFATGSIARGTPAATMLMTFVMKYGLKHGYQKISVNCHAHAARAHAFYKKMGFIQADSVRFIKTI